MSNQLRAIKALRRAVKGHKVSRRQAVAALADLLDADDMVSIPPPAAAEVLVAFIDAERAAGLAPSVRELAKATGRSRSTVQEHLDRLGSLKMLRRSGREAFLWRGWKPTKLGLEAYQIIASLEEDSQDADH